MLQVVAIAFLAFVLTGTAHAALDARDLPGVATKAVSAAQKGVSFENLSTLRKKGGGGLFKDDELLVKFKPGLPSDKAKHLHKAHGTEKLKEFPRLRLHKVRLRQGLSLEEAIALYQADPDVEYAEPNYLQSVLAQPNDPKFGELWGLQNTGQANGSVGADIDAVPAWNLTTGSSDVVVAVIDTGIDYSHPDLQPNLWSNPGEIPGNGIDDDGNGYIDDVHGINSIDSYLEARGPAAAGDPMDDHGHGTHVSGTIGAAGDDGRGVVGVTWSVKMLGCKFLARRGGGWTSDAIECLEYVNDLKARGVNILATSNSWGGGGYSQALYDAIEAQSGTLFIAAAGNSGDNTDSYAHYPSSYDLPNVISVAATSNNDSLASFSNYGRGTVDVAAPGVGIVSTVPNGAYGSSDGYASLSGTSMATPHVTGLAALLKSQAPGRDYRQIKYLIMTGGDSVSGLADTTVSGRRINAYHSLTCSNRKLFGLGALPRKLVLGQTYTVSATSIICDAASGPVRMSTSEGDQVELRDDGIAPDLHAGDAIFTATWAPRGTWVTATLSSPAGSQVAYFNDIEIGYHVPAARADLPYYQQLVVTGGTAPYTWRKADGYLQGGLSLNANGTITGTPNESGSCNGKCPFLAEVTDAGGNKVTRWLALIVDQSWTQESWGKIYDSTNEDRALAVAMDSSGNAYVTGQGFNGVDQDLVLHKYASNGGLAWTRVFQRGDDEVGRSVACDSSGNVYVAGVAGTPGNHLLLKFDGSGNLLWEKSWDRGGDDGAWGVATDSSGNSYTVGTFEDQQGSRVLLSKYSATGDPVWTRVHAGSADQSGYSISLDSSGNIFLGGATSTAQGTDFLVAKYSSAANPLWSQTVQDGVSNAVSGVASDSAGNLYATGHATSGSGTRAVTMKFDPAGNLLWKVSPTEATSYASRYRNFFPKGIAIAGDKIFIAGTHAPWIDTGLLIIRYDSLGNQIWNHAVDIGTNSMDNGGSIAATGSAFTVAGYCYNGRNNDTFTARFTEPPPIYDLQFLGLSGVVKGDQLEYTVKLKNSNVGNPRLSLGLYLSTDASYSADDFRVGPPVETSVPAGTERFHTNWPRGMDPSKEVLLPTSIPPGSYYLLAVMDPDKKVNETNENNNVTSGGRVLVNSDLTVSGLTATVAAGALSYAVTLHSSANFAAPSTATGIYLSSEPGAPGHLVTMASSITPGAGGTILVSGTAPVPASIPPGSYYVTALADAGKLIEESDESNNAFSGAPVTLANDLSVTALSGSSSGGVLSYSVTVRNSGRQQTAPAIGLYFADPGSGAAHPVAVLNSPTLGADQAGSLSGTLVVPGSVPHGTFYLSARVDPANAIAESNEANNGAQAGQVTVYSTPVALKLSITGGGRGSVSVTPGQACTGTCTQYFLPGTELTLSAAPDSASGFAGWQGACTGTGSCTVTLRADTNLSATFLDMVPAASAGDRHGHALIGGELWAWGGNLYGGFGDGTSTGSTSPRRVSGGAGLASLTAGMYHSYALKDDGTVLAWGYNSQGQLGDGSTVNRSYPAPVPALADVVAVEAKGYGGYAVLGNGTVQAWGENGYGNLGDGTDARRTVPVQVLGLSDVVALASWSSHALALKEDGTVWAWGWGLYDQLGKEGYIARYTADLVPGISDAVAVAAGDNHSVALKSDGTVWAWGGNSTGQLGDGTNVTRHIPFQVPGLSDVVAIAAGSSFNMALKRDGTVWTWGSNFAGQLGDGSTTTRFAPVQVPGLAGVTRIAAGSAQAFASKSDRTLWAWGQNYDSNLGDGSTTNRSTPVRITFDTVAPTSTATPAGGIYDLPLSVTLAASESATIYYTLDGTTPSAASPIYSGPISIPGSVQLKYRAKDGAGNLEPVQTQTYLVRSVPPVADFSAAPASGRFPLSVAFSDLSAGLPSSWSWDFGDGATSTERHPRHLYTSPGSYSVSLTVSGIGGSSSTTKSDYISVSTPDWISLQHAYDNAADGAYILVPAQELYENPFFDREVGVRVSGGYDGPFRQVVGVTKVRGKLTVRKGTVSLGNVSFR